MTTNRLARATDSVDRPIPPAEPDERVRFWIAHGNSRLAEEGRRDVEWAHSNGHYFLQPIRQFGAEEKPTHRDLMSRRGERMTSDDTYKLNAALATLGATARYREDGSRYTVDDEQAKLAAGGAR